MTKPTLERLIGGSKKFTTITLEKCTALCRELIGSDGSFASPKRRRKHAERKFRSDLQHHAIPITGFESLFCLFHCPPTGTRAVMEADVTSAGFGRRILLR